MSIIVNSETRVVVQGITGGHGAFHTRQMLEYGTKIVAGAVPGKGGQRFEDRVPIFHSVREAVSEEGANASIIFVPAPFAPDAICEAADAGVSLVVCITEGIPALEMVKVKAYLADKAVRLVGPNTPGVITPGECKLGIQAGWIHKPGPVGLISRSGTLTYEAVYQLTKLDLGQSTCLGLGGDPVLGTTFTEAIRMFNEDPGTRALVLIGEIGGTEEERAAAYIREHVEMPVVAFIAGRTAPPGVRMGHAGAIIAGGKGKAEDKIRALADAGVHIADSPAVIGQTMKEALKGS
ncbi:MAG: succinate--CoA ligase subunit alpha [Planctomycetota bacterium]|jgi:succinyl-CoA synthetase alpha subunit